MKHRLQTLLLCIIAITSLLSSCEKTPTPTPPPTAKKQTMLLYMVGRDLMIKGYYRKNLESLCEGVTASLPSDGRILVCYQPNSHDEATLLEVKYDSKTKAGKQVILKEYTEFAHKNPADLQQLFLDIQTFAPAEQYGLIIGSHGKGWVPAAEGQMTSRIVPLKPDAQDAVSDDLFQPLPYAQPTRSFGDVEHEIDVPQLASVLESLPYRFDYAIFDACLMSSIEVLYDLRNHFDEIVASPTEIMGDGFPYKAILPHLFADNEQGYNMERVCEEYYRHYNDNEEEWVYCSSTGESRPSACVARCITSELEGLAEATKALYLSPRQEIRLPDLQAYEGMTRHVFLDFEHYARMAYPAPSLLYAFRAAFDRAFPPENRLHTQSFYSAYNNRHNPIEEGCYSGVSTSEPSERYRESYAKTAWYRATREAN